MFSPTLDALREFVETPLDQHLADAETGVAEGVLSHFHSVVQQVPAYRSWLADQGVEPQAVGSLADYANLPLTSKQGYVQRYPLDQRCRGGTLDQALTVAVSTGSTGAPVIWPRSIEHELAMSYRFEQLFQDSFAAHRQRTLAVVCFSLGNWVGGMFTTACCRHLRAKGYPLGVATPGSDPPEIFRVVEQLGPLFDQLVLLGYPPFVKDVIDQGAARGIDWPALNTKLVFAGEVISEPWRSMVSERCGQRDAARSSVSLYGTADGGVLGNETPLSITIRRWLAERPTVARQLFADTRLPTLVQYDPRIRYFERHEGTLVISGDNGAPLVRYHIADKGDFAPFDVFMSKLSQQGFELDAAAVQPVRALPFVWVFGRADFTVSYYGANVYPENVKLGLEQQHTAPHTSGKFVMFVEQDSQLDAQLVIVIELSSAVPAEQAAHIALADSFAAAIVEQLRHKNSEFAHYVPEHKRTPRIELRPYADPEWFAPGIKHRYTR